MPWIDAQTSLPAAAPTQLSFCMRQSTLQGKKVMGNWEEMGKASLVIRIYGMVLERPADPTGKQDTAEKFLEQFSFYF